MARVFHRFRPLGAPWSRAVGPADAQFRNCSCRGTAPAGTHFEAVLQSGGAATAGTSLVVWKLREAGHLQTVSGDQPTPEAAVVAAAAEAGLARLAADGGQDAGVVPQDEVPLVRPLGTLPAELRAWADRERADRQRRRMNEAQPRLLPALTGGPGHAARRMAPAEFGRLRAEYEAGRRFERDEFVRGDEDGKVTPALTIITVLNPYGSGLTATRVARAMQTSGRR